MRTKFNLAIRLLAAWITTLVLMWTVPASLYSEGMHIRRLAEYSAVYTSPFFMLAVIACFSAHRAVLRNPSTWSTAGSGILILTFVAYNPFLAMFATPLVALTVTVFLWSLRMWPVINAELPMI